MCEARTPGDGVERGPSSSYNASLACVWPTTPSLPEPPPLPALPAVPVVIIELVSVIVDPVL